ncbi:Dinitrogenase iron-molybdenum cofactor biosynthesis protein [Anaeromyxobacter sp. K]|uniref:NifB/NifX family molybdenum-iron cluster-binding protein n=1 Tax=Anaeromyxobacter sp. (strain K) TaxID=447217 RepID=UPI00015F882B|nr:NifB/NifX family molybdenum-iron cluster-binding protein [Anaeromyxobacter sp. K]ACG72850.1 Dinitrogenase iron-molybdenum cofactor biosynthesis protein [Anaeromyxobacter sp. K]
MSATLCIPIEENRGLLSPVSRHFGRAPAFMLVNAATLAYRILPNAPSERPCDACRALANEDIDVFLVGGIGTHALERIRARRRIAVLRTPSGRVADALALHIAGRLPVVQEECCPPEGAPGTSLHVLGAPGAGCDATCSGS